MVPSLARVKVDAWVGPCSTRGENCPKGVGLAVVITLGGFIPTGAVQKGGRKEKYTTHAFKMSVTI